MNRERTVDSQAESASGRYYAANENFTSASADVRCLYYGRFMSSIVIK